MFVDIVISNVFNFNKHFFFLFFFLTVVVSLLCRWKRRTILSPFSNYYTGINWNMYLWYMFRVTSIVTKPWLRGNMSPISDMSENKCSYFSENERRMALKSLDLTWFLSPNLSIYFNFLRCLGSGVM